MLSGSACSYRFPGGDVSVLMARFQDSATASSGMKSLMDMLRSQSGDASIQFRPITGLGDEAAIYTGTLPPPTGGQAVGLLVRKGAVAFMLSGGFAQGSGPADLGQATEALARIASARI